MATWGLYTVLHRLTLNHIDLFLEGSQLHVNDIHPEHVEYFLRSPDFSMESILIFSPLLMAVSY